MKMLRSLSSTRSAGFTLIELLVAITILAIVAVLGWRGLDGIVRARIGLTAQLDQTRGMQLAFAQLQSDCVHVVPSEMIGNRTPFQAEQDRLLMVRSVQAENQPTRMQVVVYRFQNGALTRQESLPTRDLAELDAIWQSMLGNTGPAEAIALEEGLSGMTMRVWLSTGQTPVIVNGTTTAASISGLGNSVPSNSGSIANPGGGIPSLPPAASSNAPYISGLEMALRPNGSQADIMKIFLLGTI